MQKLMFYGKNRRPYIREVSSFQDVSLERGSTVVRFPPLPTSKGLLVTLKTNSGLYILSLSLIL